MKIGIVSPYYMHRPGGVQTLLLMFQSDYRKLGHEALIIAPRPKLNSEILKTPKGVIFFGRSTEIKFRAPFHTTLPLAAEFEPGKTIEFLKEHDFDVLHIHEPWMPMLPYQIANNAQCPIVGTLHARWPRSLMNKSLERAREPYVRSAMRKLDIITAVSTVAAQNAYDTNVEVDVEIIPNAIDVGALRKQYRKVKTKDHERYILYLNRLEKRKGPMHLLKAYKELANSYDGQPPVLIMAGGGPQEARLKEFVERNELNVRFEGFVTEDRKAELFANAAVYVSPAPYGESFGVVLLEAMAAGTPIVAGNNEGYQTVMQGVGALSLVDPTNKYALAERLKVMLDNNDVRKAWRAWANVEVLKYDHMVISKKYEALLKKAVKSFKLQVSEV